MIYMNEHYSLPRQNPVLKTLLKHDKFVSIHVKNLQYLATEISKIKNDLCPEIMKEIFIFHENPTYDLRSRNHLTRRNIRTTHYGIEKE